MCVPGTAVDCDDGNPCTIGSCELADGNCSQEPVNDGTGCGNDKLCVAGACAESRCGDGYVDASAGEECDDGGNGSDQDGCRDDCKFTCKAHSDCDDGSACTTDACDAETHTCSNTAVVCNDGDPCTSDGICNPGSGCLHPLIDADGDGYAPFICSPTGSHATQGEDCNDGDARVFPGQTGYFTTEMVGGGWDYDCSDTGDPRYPSTQRLCLSGSTSAGWANVVAACGVTSNWRDCATGLTTTRTQSCR